MSEVLRLEQISFTAESKPFHTLGLNFSLEISKPK